MPWIEDKMKEVVPHHFREDPADPPLKFNTKAVMTYLTFALIAVFFGVIYGFVQNFIISPPTSSEIFDCYSGDTDCAGIYKKETGLLLSEADQEANGKPYCTYFIAFMVHEGNFKDLAEASEVSGDEIRRDGHNCDEDEDEDCNEDEEDGNVTSGYSPALTAAFNNHRETVLIKTCHHDPATAFSLATAFAQTVWNLAMIVGALALRFLPWAKRKENEQACPGSGPAGGVTSSFEHGPAQAGRDNVV